MNDPKEALEAARLIDRLERLSRSPDARTGLNPAQWEALRYAARANRFSRSPAALADYLGSTRGTVSQTLIALEDKGLIARQQNPKDRRSLELVVTDAGHAMLAGDPLIDLARDIAAGSGDDVSALVDLLRATLRQTIRRNGGKSFGACRTCRHFQRNAVRSSTMPHRCGLLNEPLSDADGSAICAEHEEAGDRTGRRP